MIKCLKWISDFGDRNRDTIMSAIALTTFAYICHKFKVPMSVGGFDSFGYEPRDTFKDIIFANSPSEMTIASLYKTAKDATWDSDKLRVAKDIYDVLDTDGLPDDNTKMFAIKTLSNLSDEMTWSSSKRKIAEIIKDINDL